MSAHLFRCPADGEQVALRKERTLNSMRALKTAMHSERETVE